MGLRHAALALLASAILCNAAGARQPVGGERPGRNDARPTQSDRQPPAAQTQGTLPEAGKPSAATAKGDAVAANDNNLPDLGTPNDPSPSLNSTGQGLKLNTATRQYAWEAGGEYSSLLGPVARGSLTHRLDGEQALRTELTLGSRHMEGQLVWGTGLGTDQVLRLGLQYLSQKKLFAFESGEDKAWVGQATGSATWRLYRRGGLIEHVDVSGWYSVAPAKDLQDRDFTVNDPSFFTVYRDPRRIAGRSQLGGEAKARLRMTARDTLDLGGGLQQDKETTLLSTPSTARGIGSARWNHELDSVNRLSAGLRSSPNSQTADLQWNLATAAGPILGLQLSRSVGTGGIGNDTRLMLQYSVPLEKRPASRRSAGADTGNEVPLSQRVFDTVREKLDFLPSVVATRIDTTAKKQVLVQVAKAGLPAGASVLPNGNVVFNFGASLGTFTSAVNTTTAVAIPAALFIINGNVLTLQVPQLEPYLSGSTAAAPHTVTLTTSTSVITIQAYKGSVHIVRITSAASGVLMTVDDTPCATTTPRPGCTFNRSDGSRVTVEQDLDYNYYGFGSDDLFYVNFFADGTADVYNDLGVYQFTRATSTFAGFISGNTIGVGTTGLFWENVAGGTYWLGRDGVLYNANIGDVNYRKAIN